MSKRRGVFSGKLVGSVLVKEFGFSFVSQKGSHMKLRAGKRMTIVPLHKELAHGTLRSVLELAGILKDDFLKAVEKR